MPVEFIREHKPDAQSAEAEAIVRALAHGAPEENYEAMRERARQWLERYAG